MNLCNYNWNVTSMQAYSVIAFNITDLKYDILNDEEGINISEKNKLTRFSLDFEKEGKDIFFRSKYIAVLAKVIDRLHFIYLINKDFDHMKLTWDFARGG